MRGNVEEGTRILRIPGHEPEAEPVEVLVHIPLARVGHFGGLEIGSLDDPDCRPQWEQRLEVVRGAEQISLERQTHPVRAGSRAAVERERPVHVRGALHVDPEEVAVRVGARKQAVQMPFAERRIEVEPELRRLDRYLRVEAGRGHRLEHFHVVVGNALSLFRRREVLAKGRQDRGYALRPETLGCADGILDPLPRHEPANRAPHERRTGCAFAQPRIGGPGEQNSPHQTHGTRRISRKSGAV